MGRFKNIVVKKNLSRKNRSLQYRTFISLKICKHLSVVVEGFHNLILVSVSGRIKTFSFSGFINLTKNVLKNIKCNS